QIIPTAEALGLATRQEVTYDFFSSFSFRFSHLPLLLFPHLYGGSELGVRGLMPYTGITEINGYLGILPWLLGAAGYLLMRRMYPEVRFWIWIIPISFLLV